MDRALSMSKFSSRKDYNAAVVEQEGYDPQDAFNDGEFVRLNGGASNPYDSKTQPVCYAAWVRGLNGATS